MTEASGVRWLVCGATAGLAVDLTLYPLDTIKTRLQSAQGFRGAGGFRSLYSGMGSVAVGSAPGAAVFFLAYKSTSTTLGKDSSLAHALAACVGETLACTIRVPTELVKQRAQANPSLRLSSIIRSIYAAAGPLGLFRGYGSTVAREIPFSLIEFPLWEALKRLTAKRQGKDECSPLAGAACGSVAGGVAAGITTPLDVAKTRIMLTPHEIRAHDVMRTLKQVYGEGGMSRLFAGALPRSLWMSIGGFIFFGAYEAAMAVTNDVL